MAIWRKDTSPVDRAVEDLEQQIATLQRQMRAAEAGKTKPQSPVAATAESMTKFVKEMLTPPHKNISSAYRPKRDLFDGAAEPMKELEAEAIAFAPRPQTDLFAPAKKIDCAPKPEEKLGIYISAGSLHGFKKPLRVEQRKNRNRFFMWLGLSFVALWFIWAVVR
jgi:hypothetical protein